MKNQNEQPEIILREVEKTFYAGSTNRSDTYALENINMQVSKGEIYCLLGPSGCGKSTILNIVAGFDQATAGTVLVADQPVQRAGPDRVVVFQQALLFPWLNVRNNIVFGPRVRGENRTKTAERADFLLEATGLTQFENHYVYELSGGMQQRVALARALINEPEVLLMDEPFGALDAQTRVDMQELLMKVWIELKPTVLFVTHDVDEALFVGDRVGVMSRRPGRIKSEVDIDVPLPRTYEMLTEQKFVELKRQILQQIRGSEERAKLD